MYDASRNQTEVRILLAGGLGEPWTSKTGLFQGYSLSMFFLRLLLRLWTALILQQDVIPKQLVHDMLAHDVGPDGVSKIKQAGVLTDEYISALGQDLAPKTGYTWASTQEGQQTNKMIR